MKKGSRQWEGKDIGERWANRGGKSSMRGVGRW